MGADQTSGGVAMKNEAEIRARIRALKKVRDEAVGPVTKGEKRTMNFMIGELLWMLGDTGLYEMVKD